MYANRLRELRLEHGYTMEEVGKKVGIKKSSYASYEARYRQPPLEKLKSFSNLYGVSVDYILGLSNERNSEESFRVRLRDICTKRGFHWDGQDIPEEVFHLLGDILEEASRRYQEQRNRQEC